MVMTCVISEIREGRDVSQEGEGHGLKCIGWREPVCLGGHSSFHKVGGKNEGDDMDSSTLTWARIPPWLLASNPGSLKIIIMSGCSVKWD